MTYQLIETKTLGTAAASIEFTSIPQDATDLVVLWSVRTAGTGDGNFQLQFNGSTTSFSYRLLYGTGSGAASASGTNNLMVALTSTNYTANTFNNGSMYLPNYTGSTNKSFSIDNVTETNATGSYQDIWAGLWSNTAAITSMTFGSTTGNFVAGSTIALYKITKGSSGGVVVS